MTFKLGNVSKKVKEIVKRKAWNETFFDVGQNNITSQDFNY